MNITLVLKRDNTSVVVSDWLYPIPPTTYYHNRNRLIIETYEFEYLSKDGTIAYYVYNSEQSI